MAQANGLCDTIYILIMSGFSSGRMAHVLMGLAYLVQEMLAAVNGYED